MTTEGCRPIAEAVRRLDVAEESPIIIVIDTAGGSGVAGDIIAAVISFCRSPTVGLVITRAASAGFTVLQACDLRLALATSSILTHHSRLPASGDEVKSAADVDALVDWKAQRAELYASVWAKEIEVLCRRTGLDIELAKHLLGRDRLVPAQQAFEMGFIDGIV